MPGVYTVGNSTYIMGERVYLSSPRTHQVQEGNTAWNPDYVEVGREI